MTPDPTLIREVRLSITRSNPGQIVLRVLGPLDLRGGDGTSLREGQALYQLRRVIGEDAGPSLVDERRQIQDRVRALASR